MEDTFNYQSFLTYIVLAFIAAITIHLLFKIYYVPKEHFIVNDRMTDLNILDASYAIKNSILPDDDTHTKIHKSRRLDKYDIPAKNNSDDSSNSYKYDSPRYDADFFEDIDIKHQQNKKKKNKNPKNYGTHKRYSTLINKNYNDNINYVDTGITDPDNYADDHIDEITGIGAKTPNYTDCVSCGSDNTYVKEFVLNNNEPCPTIPKKFTNEDLQNYRDDFFNFRNKINQSSEGVNPIDILNERILAGQGDLADMNDPNNPVKLGGNAQGQKISELYDSLTANSYGPYHENCMISPNFDTINMSPQYKKYVGNGEYYTRDNWAYEKDRIMNGGAFFNDVTGADSDDFKDTPQAISYR